MSFETIWVKIRADLADYNKKMSEMSMSLTNAGKQMKSVGSQMSMQLTAPIALFGASTLKAAGDFESGMNRVKALTNATNSEFNKLSKLAKELGATTQFSASEAAEAMGFLAMAGLSAEKIYASMPDTLNLAAAAQIDMASAADIVTNVLTGMQTPMEELPNAVDILSKAFTSANTDLRQLGQAMKFVGPVSTSFNQSMEGTIGVLGLLGNAGIQAGMAGRGYRTLLVELSKKQKDLGIVMKDSSGKMLPMIDILKNLEKAGYSSQDAMVDFSAASGTVLSTLLLQGSKELERFTSKLQDAGGTAKNIAEVQMSGLNGAIKEVKSAFEAFQLALADSGVLAWVTDFAKGIADWFREMSKTNPEILRMGTAIAAVLAAAGPLLAITGAIVTGLGAMLGPVSLIIGALGGLAAVMAANSLQVKEHKTQLELEKEGLNSLVNAITRANISEDVRRGLIDELQMKYPNFLKNIDTEKVTNDELRKALSKVNSEYEQKIVNALREEELSNLIEKKVGYQKDELKLTQQISDLEQQKFMNSRDDAAATNSQLLILHNALNSNKALQEALNKEIEKTDDLYAKLNIPKKKVVGGSETPTGGTGGGKVDMTFADEAKMAEDSWKSLIITQSQADDLMKMYHEHGVSANQAIVDSLIPVGEIEDENTDAAERYIEAKKKQQKEQEKLTEQERKDHEERMAMLLAWANASATVVNLIGQMQTARMNKELEDAGDNEEKQDQIRKKYGAKRKRQAIAEALVNGALAVTNILAHVPGSVINPATWVAIGTAVASTAAQVGIISAQPLAKGGLAYGPTHAIVGDNPNARLDPEVISPLSKLKGYMSGMNKVEVFGVIRGEDIYLSNAEHTRRIQRTRS